MLKRMPRFAALVGLAIGLTVPLALASTPQSADARAQLVGSWRVVTYELEFQDGSERRLPLGSRPNGYLVFGADGRMMAYLEADARTPPQTDEQRSAAYKTMVAYTGKYRVQDGKWITKIDGTWNVDWLGTSQERSFTISGDRMNVVAQWNRNALYAGRMTRGRLTFERDK